MHLDEEEVEPVSQKHLVVSRGHAIEPPEELFLLLGGRWKHELCLHVIERCKSRPESDKTRDHD